MNLDADSEVVFNEKPERKEVLMEVTPEDVTIRFDLRALTQATSPPG